MCLHPLTVNWTRLNRCFVLPTLSNDNVLFLRIISQTLSTREDSIFHFHNLLRQSLKRIMRINSRDGYSRGAWRQNKERQTVIIILLSKFHSSKNLKTFRFRFVSRADAVDVSISIQFPLSKISESENKWLKCRQTRFDNEHVRVVWILNTRTRQRRDIKEIILRWVERRAAQSFINLRQLSSTCNVQTTSVKTLSNKLTPDDLLRHFSSWMLASNLKPWCWLPIFIGSALCCGCHPPCVATIIDDWFIF